MNLPSKLRCVGGPSDGAMFILNNPGRLGDFVKVYSPIQPVKIYDIDNLTPMQVESTYTYYVISCIRFPNSDPLYFLRPDNMTDAQALKQHFN